jgi:flagellar basal-body rod modification protein FlgD
MTTATIPSSTVNSINGSGTSGSALGTTTTAQDQSDRFLKLLVAQMQNQDPLNPMDSAQVTSQMAQISTVQGVTNLNTTMTGLNAQFVQMQTMQGAALVGHTVATEGNSLHEDATTHAGTGGYELAATASAVTLEIDDATGAKVGTVDLGAQTQGRHDFSYAIPTDYQGKGLTFKITATAGTGATPVDTMALTYNKISAVSNLNGQLALELDNGQRIAYDAVWAFI